VGDETPPVLAGEEGSRQDGGTRSTGSEILAPKGRALKKIEAGLLDPLVSSFRRGPLTALGVRPG